MASSFTTPIDLNKKNDSKPLNDILEPFGFTVSQLSPLLYKTSAVMAGGAVTHYLATRNPALGFSDMALPPTSDLDFWVYRPIPYTVECVHPNRVFKDLINAEFMRLLEPLGFKIFSYPMKRDGFLTATQDYMDCKAEFKTQGGVTIHVQWLYNETTKRLINLIFTDKPIEETVSKFDLPISRAFMYGSKYCGSQYDTMFLTYDRRILEDLKDRRLTAPDPKMTGKKTAERYKKYMERYGMGPRDDIAVVPDVAEVPVVPVSVAAVPVVPVSVAAVPEFVEDADEEAPTTSRGCGGGGRVIEIPPPPLTAVQMRRAASSLPALEIPTAPPVMASDEPGSPRKRRSGQVESVVARLDPVVDELVAKLEDLLVTLKRVKEPSADADTIERLQFGFMEAVRAGRVDVVEQLLQDRDASGRLCDRPCMRVDPSANNNEAIRCASVDGFVAVVNRLLQDPRVDPSANNNEAIRYASSDGHQAVVNRLLQDPRVDPSANDNEAIRCASSGGHVAVVERLLKDPRVDPSANDNEAIRCASSGGHVAVVDRLLKDPRVDPSARNNEAIRPAVANGHVAIKMVTSGGAASDGSAC
jgi:hypothetical protein